MFNTISMAGTGMYVSVLAVAFKLIGLDFDYGQLTELVNSIAFIIGFVLQIIGTFRRPDLTAGIVRK